VSGSDVVGDEDLNQPFTIVEQMPEFPGGEKALLTYLRDNIRYPAMAKENDIEGTVYVQFVIERDGSVSGAKVAKGADRMLNEEALRVVSAMPKWKPGKQRGQEVRVQYVVPIKFILQ
jgi:protein TonB